MLFLMGLTLLGFVGCSGSGISLEASIDEDSLEDITASNVAHYTLSGTCSDNEQPVIVTIGTLEIETECEKESWEVSADLTSMNKVSGEIEISVEHIAASNEDEDEDKDDEDEDEEKSQEGVLSLTVKATVNNEFVCPENFVGIPSLEDYTEDSFCLSKYEMKNDGSDNAISQAADIPYVSLSQTEAVTACANANYELVTNDEWQTVARNIEQQDMNWESATGGSVGGLSRGHSDDSPSNSLAATEDNDEGCDGTEETCDGSTWATQRRTHVLSNGEIVWDLAGNVSEWVKDTNSSVFDADAYISQVTATSHATSGALSGGTTTTSRTAKDQFGPVEDYISLSSGDYGGLGYGILSGSAGAIYRGGVWSSVEKSGVFFVGLDNAGDTGSAEIGFRCAYHP